MSRPRWRAEVVAQADGDDPLGAGLTRRSWLETDRDAAHDARCRTTKPVEQRAAGERVVNARPRKRIWGSNHVEALPRPLTSPACVLAVVAKRWSGVRTSRSGRGW